MGKILYDPRVSNEQPAQEPQQESWSGAIQRNLNRSLGTLTKTAGVPGDISEAISGLGSYVPKQISNALSYIPKGFDPSFRHPELPEGSKYLPTSESIGKHLEPLESKLPNISSKPQGTKEEIFDWVVGDLPWLVSSGGLSALPKGILRSASAATASKGAKSLGAGAVGQAGAAILGGLSFDTIQKKGFIPQLRKNATKVMEHNYKQAEKNAIGKSMPDNGLRKSFEDEASVISKGSGLDDAQRSKALKEISFADDMIQGNKVSLDNAWTKKKHFNKLIGKESDTDLKRIYSRISGAINERIMEPATKKYPDFGKYYIPAEDLYKGINAPSKVREVIENFTNYDKIITSPLAQFVLGGGGIGSIATAGIPATVKGAALAVPPALAIRGAARSIDFLNKSKEARKMLKDIGKAAVDENLKLLPSYLSKFNSLAESYESK